MAAFSVRAIFIATAFAAAAAVAAAEATLADFQIFAVKPADDTNAASLVEIGAADVEPAKLNALVASLPVDFWGGVNAASDINAEAALCSSACASRALCRSITYDPPTKDRPVGVCHLKTDAAQTFGKMSPVDDAAEPKPVTSTEAEAIPPPPVLTITVEPMSLPQRAVAEAPPTSIVPAPKAAPAKVAEAKPAPRERRRYMPVWVIFAMLAFVIGGALLYRRNYFARQRKEGIAPVPAAPVAHDLAA
jgi:hypothetical protein